MIEIGDIGSAPIQNVLEIKDVNNVVKCRYVMGKNDALTKELMSRNDISTSFNYPSFVRFKKGDYIMYENERYTLMKDFKVTDNKGEYRYELVFHAKEILIQDAQYFYTNSNIHQSEFTLTGNAQYFFQLAVEDINAHFGANFVNLGAIESTDIKQITFANNTNVFSALHQVCEVFGLEYLFAGDTINTSKKVNFGDAIDFKIGESILSVNRREGDNVFTANRILALGSTTNLTRDYQGGDYMIGSKRLRIPQSKGTFIDLKEGLQPTEIETATVIFDDVFPHRIGNVDEVREVEYEDKDEDGNDIILKQWRFKDNGIIFSEDYLLPNEPLMLVFESGRLAGQHFEVAFRKGNYNDTDNSQNYEILLNDRGLPNETLYPQIGDKYVLYNFNIALVSNIYIPEAENKLYDTAVPWLKEQHTDKGVYECPIMTDYARTNDANLEIGQRVNLFAPMFDETTRQTGNRESRIMGYVKPLLDWSTATYTIGDNSAYSSKSNIQQRITKLEAFEYVDAGVGGVSGSVYIIKQFDLTRPTDFNVYSAKATDAMYFNRQKGGSVLGDTLFTKNVQTHGVNVSDVFQNSTFTAGAFGTGMQFKNDANGYSYGEIDYLRVRKEMLVSQLTIDEIKSVGGTILLSLANLTASNVVDNGTSYRVYFDNQDGKLLNQFTVGDQAIRQTFNGTNIVRYWRLVTGVGVDYIDLSKTDAEQSSSVPLVGDEIIQLGNRTNVMRQHAILLSAYGSDAPSIKQYSGINSFSLLNKEVTVISPSGNKFKGTFEITSNGTTTAVYKDRGKFINGTTYYKNDRVSHNGSLWVCDVTSTTVTPNESTMAWIKETSGDVDIKNAIDNIQIGGVNFFLNSGDYSANWKRKYIGEVITNRYYNGSRIVEYHNSWNGIGYVGKNIESKPYMYSFYARITELEPNNNGYLIVYGATKQEWLVPIKALTKEWTQFSIIVTPNITDASGLRLEPNMAVATGQAIELCGFKLESGNKATSWSPAPEDIQNEINQVGDDLEQLSTQTTAKFQILDDKIESKVDSQTYNQLDQLVQTHSSQITQLDKSITSTVEKVDNISIGGVNMLFGTRDFSNIGGRKWVFDSVKVEPNIGYNGISSTIATAPWQRAVQYYDLDEGKTYTFSCYVKSNVANKVEFNIHLNSNGKYLIPYRFIDKADTWERVEFTFEVLKGDAGRFETRVEARKANIDERLYTCGYKLEEGNIATSWDPAPEDIFTDINSKNKISHQNAAPEHPNVGDFWIMKSLVDSNGVINADQSKNIYQLQMRWDGTTWQRVNWSASKSKVEQTDAQILSTVEKTGINNLGQNETLYSYINQQNNEIVLEVGEVRDETVAAQNLANAANNNANSAQNKANKAEQDAADAQSSANNAKNIADSKTTPTQVNNQIKSTVKITPNSVEVDTQKMIVNADLIATAIETDSLTVGKATTKSQMIVGKEGQLYARGENARGEKMIIDSSTQSITVGGTYIGYGSNGAGVSNQRDMLVTLYDADGLVAQNEQTGSVSSLKAGVVELRAYGRLVLIEIRPDKIDLILNGLPTSLANASNGGLYTTVMNGHKVICQK